MWLTKLKCVTNIRRSPMIWTTNATHDYGDMARAAMKIKYGRKSQFLLRMDRYLKCYLFVLFVLRKCLIISRVHDKIITVKLKLKAHNILIKMA